MNLRNLFLTLFIFGPVVMFASLAGTYEVHGFDPLSNSKYSGTLVITKNGPIYSATWTFGGGVDTGTGVRKDDSLSFVFREGNANSFGVQVYEIEGDHTLKGPWVRYGATSKGYEKIKKISSNTALVI